MIPFLLVIASLVGAWMLTANSLIYNFQYMKITLGQLDWWILNRLLILPFFIILAIVVAGEFLFSNTIVRFCVWLS